jgi:hypothetical protein
MEPTVAHNGRGNLLRVRALLARATIVLALLLAGPVVTSAAQPPATTAAQDGFVPVDSRSRRRACPRRRS